MLATGRGRIIITACREEQRSYIGSELLTIFTQALVDGLRGKRVGNSSGYISAYNLYEYIFTTVRKITSDQFKVPQEPELAVIKGVEPFAVALYKGASSLGEFNENQTVPNLPAVHQVEPDAGWSGGNVVKVGNISNVSGGQINIAGRDIIKKHQL